VQQVQHRGVRADLQDLRLLPARLAGADGVGRRGVPAAQHLLGLLVERAAERLHPLQRGADDVLDPEPRGAHLDGRLVGAHEVPPDQHLGAVADPERVGHLRRSRFPADAGQLLAVPGGEVGVVAAVGPVPAAGQPVEPAAGAAHVRTAAGFGDQDALDPQLVDGALDGLFGHAEHLGHRRDGRQPLARLPVAAADPLAELAGDLPVRELGGAGVDRHAVPRLIVMADRSNPRFLGCLRERARPGSDTPGPIWQASGPWKHSG
jgi:hypothetical protein